MKRIIILLGFILFFSSPTFAQQETSNHGSLVVMNGGNSIQNPEDLPDNFWEQFNPDEEYFIEVPKCRFIDNSFAIMPADGIPGCNEMVKEPHKKGELMPTMREVKLLANEVQDLRLQLEVANIAINSLLEKVHALEAAKQAK